MSTIHKPCGQLNGYAALRVFEGEGLINLNLTIWLHHNIFTLGNFHYSLLITIAKSIYTQQIYGTTAIKSGRRCLEQDSSLGLGMRLHFGLTS